MPTGVVISGILPLLLLFLIPVARSYPPHKRCPDCGYDLHGLLPTNACPECGRPPGPAPRPWLALITVLPLAVGSGAASVFLFTGWSTWPQGVGLIFLPFAVLAVFAFFIHFLFSPAALIGFVSIGLAIATSLIARAGHMYLSGATHDQAAPFTIKVIFVATVGAPALAAAGAILAHLVERMLRPERG